MRWQQIARLVIAAVVIAVAAMVFVALRRPGPAPVRDKTPRTDPGTVAETRRGTYNRTTPDGKLLFTLAFEGELTYPDGRHVLSNATLTLPDRDGRTITISGTEMEVASAKEGPGEIANARMSKGVKLRTSDGLEIESEQATYEEKTGVLTVPGDVRFTKERLQGSGLGATYDKNRDVLWLLDRAKLVVAPDAQGAGALDASASSMGLARAEHYIRLVGNAHVVSDGRTLDTQELTVQLTPDDRLIQTMALRGSSRITGSPAGGGVEGMSARDIDLTYAADGRALQHAKLMEDAVAQLPGSGGAGPRRIAARLIDLGLGPDGSTVTSLDAAQKVEVTLPPTPEAPARRIESAALTAGGPSGLQSATFSGGVTYREMRAAAAGAAASERVGRSQRLVIETQPGFGAIQQADFRGNVQITDAETKADGQRAIYRVADDSFDLAPSAGDPGPPPSVNDGRVLVHARHITFAIASRKLKADTDVRSSLQPGKRGAANGRGRGGASEGGKLPSMLKDDEPVNVTSNRLDYDSAAALATYNGDARLFQGSTFVKGDTIVVNDRTGNLTATGKVQTVMFFDEVDAATKTKRPVQTTATGHEMVYEDAKRLATYTTGPTNVAHIVGTQGDVTGDRIRLFLKKEANELERAEADGHVIVKEGNRTATGDHLTYTTADETYVMTGAPVEVEEKTPSECRVTVASKVTFKRSAVSTVVENNGVTPVTTRPCVAR